VKRRPISSAATRRPAGGNSAGVSRSGPDQKPPRVKGAEPGAQTVGRRRLRPARRPLRQSGPARPIHRRLDRARTIAAMEDGVRGWRGTIQAPTRRTGWYKPRRQRGIGTNRGADPRRRPQLSAQPHRTTRAQRARAARPARPTRRQSLGGAWVAGSAIWSRFSHQFTEAADSSVQDLGQCVGRHAVTAPICSRRAGLAPKGPGAEGRVILRPGKGADGRSRAATRARSGTHSGGDHEVDSTEDQGRLQLPGQSAALNIALQHQHAAK